MNKCKHGDHPLIPLHQFTATPGINFDIPEDANELYFFKLFFTNEFLDYLTDETNRYGHDFFQVNKDKLRPSSDFKKWPENGISLGKMTTFLALTLYFGIMKKDLLKSYWSTNSVLIKPLPRTETDTEKKSLVLFGRLSNTFL